MTDFCTITKWLFCFRTRVRNSVLAAFDEALSDDDSYAMVSGRLDVIVPWLQQTGPSPPAIPPPTQSAPRRAPSHTSPARARPRSPDMDGVANSNDASLINGKQPAPQPQAQLRSQHQHPALVATCSLTSSISVSSTPASPTRSSLAVSLPPLGAAFVAALGVPGAAEDAEFAEETGTTDTGTVVRRRAPSSPLTSTSTAAPTATSSSATCSSSASASASASATNDRDSGGGSLSIGAMSTCHVLCEGILKRKTILKEWRRSTLAAWHRFWVALTSDGNLLYFEPRNTYFSPLGHKLHKRSDVSSTYSL